MSPYRKLNEVAQIYDGPHATPERISHGPYFLNIASLKSGHLDLSQSDHVSKLDFIRWTKRVEPRYGDVLFSYETRLGEAALMPEGVQACLGRRMALLRPKTEEVSPQYLLYSYLSPLFQDMIKQNTVRGATVDRISLSRMGAWPIYLPSKSYQRRLTRVLGALDDKISIDQDIIKRSLMLSSAIVQQEISTLPSDESDSFTNVSLGELASEGSLLIGDGYRTKRSELSSSGYRIIRVADVREGTVRPHGTDYVESRYARNIGNKVAQVGDVLVTTKGTVGRAAILPEGLGQAVYSPQVCFLRTMDESRISRHFLRHWLVSSEFKRQAADRMNNTDMAAYINLADLRSVRLTLPSRRRRENIMETLKALDQKTEDAVKETQGLENLRDTLLPELMSGRMRVREAEEQVGEVL